MDDVHGQLGTILLELFLLIILAISEFGCGIQYCVCFQLDFFFCACEFLAERGALVEYNESGEYPECKVECVIDGNVVGTGTAKGKWTAKKYAIKHVSILSFLSHFNLLFLL